MNSKRALILSANEGHRSLGLAAQEALKASGWQVTIHETDLNFYNAYKPFYLFFPSLFKIPYKLSQHKQAQKAISSIAQLKFQKPVFEQIKQTQPHLILTTWFMYLPVVETLKIVNPIPTINIVPDPRTIHPFTISPFVDQNLVFDSDSVSAAQEIRPDVTAITPTGWLVQKKYSPPKSKSHIRSKLGLKPDLLTFLITGGSEGTNTISKIAPAFIQSSTPAQIVVNVGNNKLLPKFLTSLKNLSSYYPKSKLTFSIVPFTKHLNQYMQAADLIIGKAGPNTLFESIACHTPFFAITHIAGQEDGNLDIIRDYQVGMVEEQPLAAIKKIRTIIKKPDILKQFSPSVVKLSAYNQQAFQLLQTQADQLLKASETTSAPR